MQKTEAGTIRLKGIPEATMGADLCVSVTAIFYQLLADPPSSVIEIDWVHWVPAARVVSQEAPQDVLCTFSLWKRPSCVKHGRKVRSTLQCSGATYTWRYPLSRLVKKDNRSFSLFNPSQLPQLFVFLSCQAIKVPDWTALPRSWVSQGSPSPQRDCRSWSRSPPSRMVQENQMTLKLRLICFLHYRSILGIIIMQCISGAPIVFSTGVGITPTTHSLC